MGQGCEIINRSMYIYSISYYDGNVTGIQFYTAMIGRYFPCGIGFQLHKGKMKTVKRMVSFLY